MKMFINLDDVTAGNTIPIDVSVSPRDKVGLLPLAVRSGSSSDSSSSSAVTTPATPVSQDTIFIKTEPMMAEKDLQVTAAQQEFDQNKIIQWYCCQCANPHGDISHFLNTTPDYYLRSDCSRCAHLMCPYCTKGRLCNYVLETAQSPTKEVSHNLELSDDEIEDVLSLKTV